MLVTFRTKGYPHITMFGDVAKQLLELMGHSGTIPSAIKAGYDAPRRVTLPQRAVPLLELLRTAVARTADVMWDS